MIAHVRGVVSEKIGTGSLIIDVHGVGYEVMVSTLDFEAMILNEEVNVYTYHQVREQSEDLYGFLNLTAKKIFELLISVQGVGPKAALAIMSLSTPENVRNAIANSDSTFIQKAAGVGKKTAERVVVDLRDKVGLPTTYGRIAEPISGDINQNDEALEALMALGYSLSEGISALEKVDPNLPVNERITLALKGGA